MAGLRRLAEVERAIRLREKLLLVLSENGIRRAWMRKAMPSGANRSLYPISPA